MDLREALSGVAAHGYGHRKGKDQPAQQHLNAARRELLELVPPGMRVLVSGSGVSLPVVPWIAVLNLDVTATAQSGLYVVYLYRADLSRVYLSMNQGATQHQANAVAQGLKGVSADKAACVELARESELMRGGLSDDTLSGLLPEIDLGADGFLPRAYEYGNVAAIEYDCASLPTEAELLADLERFLALYSNCVEIKNEILADQPGTIHTTAGSGKTPKPTLKPPTFRPKDASDYRANVKAQQQTKTRRHEDLINIFAKWLKTAGCTPANNVHPRDLTVDAGGQHWLVEAKTVGPNAEYAVRAAIGQLMSYRHFIYRDQGLPDPYLVALFSEPIGPAFADLLASIGIEAIWRRGRQWHGHAPAGVPSLLAQALAAHASNV